MPYSTKEVGGRQSKSEGKRVSPSERGERGLPTSETKCSE